MGKLLGMLSSTEQIFSFNSNRHHSFVPALKEAVGPKVYDTYMGAAPLMMNYVGNMGFGGKPHIKVLYLDSAKVKDAKDKCSGKDTDFVSTNDVVTAWWGSF